MERHELADGTVLSIQRPERDDRAAALAVLFDGIPMIRDGIPKALGTLQGAGIMAPLVLVCIESIEGERPRGVLPGAHH